MCELSRDLEAFAGSECHRGVTIIVITVGTPKKYSARSPAGLRSSYILSDAERYRCSESRICPRPGGYRTDPRVSHRFILTGGRVSSSLNSQEKVSSRAVSKPLDVLLDADQLGSVKLKHLFL